MKMKKMAAVLSAAAMAVTSLSITAFAATPVEVTDFASLKTALTADPAPTEIIAKGQIVVNEDIDLKGATLKAAAATDYNTAGNGMVLINGDVKVSNGTIDGNDMDYTLNSGNGYYVINVLGGHSEVTFENMKVQSGKPEDNQAGTQFTKSSIINVGTHLTLKDCTITTSGKSAALKADDAGITIDGGKVEAYYPIMMWENVTIKGGAEVKANGGKNAVQIGVWNGYNDTTKAKLNIEDATIDGAVSILSKQAGVWPTINVGAEATLKNFDVVASDAYKGDPNFDTTDSIEADFNIDENATVEFAAGADPDSKYLKKVAQDNEIVIVPGEEASHDYTYLADDWSKSASINLTSAKEGDKIVIEFNKLDTGAQIKIGIGDDGVILDAKDIADTDLTDNKFEYVLTKENIATIAADKQTEKWGYVGGKKAVIKVTLTSAAKPDDTDKGTTIDINKLVSADIEVSDKYDGKDNITIPAVKAGDKIVVAVEKLDDKGAAPKLKFVTKAGSNWGWTELSDEVEAVDGKCTYTVQAADVDKINSNHTICFVGSNAKITKSGGSTPGGDDKPATTTKNEAAPVVPNIRPVAPETAPAETDANGNVVTTEAPATTAGDNGGSTSEGDKNQNTGIVLAVIPAVIAAAGVVISKKRK